jgi:excisionase family DNA binding protein
MTTSRLAPGRGNNPPSLPRLYSIPEVADAVGVSTKTVRRWIKAGALPAHRLGKQIRISQPDLAAFIAQSRSTEGCQ